ncbi:SCP2 sterol-binding domain-containing protein [Ahrensia sp. R2A130]|uniref:SCP2 sterol-binding domain-containing protein n=1 Tax=Ahrensia sp. R2A130 TaxID=744979 RepID=UPI0001E08419|nr:SCP2 sterol-binding domain-containing protein [Ahrensia sp. R2A130]EFL89079.1 sterol-binding domain-containing protein [Ahrensia sp. R2A130]
MSQTRPADPTVRQIIAAMPERFNAEVAGPLKAIIQFRLDGEQGGEWYADIADGKCALIEGRRDDASITLKMAAATYVDMVMGRITGQNAFFTRKLTYKGDISLAIRLHKLFRPPEAAELEASA